MSSLSKRALSAIILLPPLAWILFKGKIWFFGLALSGVIIGCYEFSHMMRHKGYQISLFLITALASVPMIDAGLPNPSLLKPGVAAVIFLSLLWYIWIPGAVTPLLNWALNMAGGILLGWLGAYAILLRALPLGLEWCCLALIGIWMNDGFAYVFGKWLGRHPAFPRLSPYKTWEGTIGGAVVAWFSITLLAPVTGITFSQGMILGLLIPITATMGDLTISFFKRQTAVKDAGQLIPGHGGLLDRLDSILFSLPLVYYFALLVTG